MANMSHEQKLALVSSAEKTGILENVTIQAFRANCPFCFSNGSFHISIHSRNYPCGYACFVCGEIGDMGQLLLNLRTSRNRSNKKKIRRDNRLKEIDVIA